MLNGVQRSDQVRLGRNEVCRGPLANIGSKKNDGSIRKSRCEAGSASTGVSAVRSLNLDEILSFEKSSTSSPTFLRE